MKALLLIALSALALQESEPWRLVYGLHKDRLPVKFKSVRMDGTGLRDETEGQQESRFRLWVFLKGGTSVIAVSEGAPDKNPVELTDGKSLDLSPSWTSDGKRVVFQSNRSGKPQVWIMDQDGKNAVRLTDHVDGATQPRASPASEVIAYREEHPAREKLPPSTLRTMDLSGRNPKVLIERTQMQGHAWSPEGGQLAVSLVNELRILEIPSGKTTKSFKFEEIHKELYAHAAYGLTWRPDGKAIACTIQFLGGRTEGAEIFGDQQVFILPFEGKPVVIDAGGPAGPVRWTR